jgi:hypothetical protein
VHRMRSDVTRCGKTHLAPRYLMRYLVCPVFSSKVVDMTEANYVERVVAMKAAYAVLEGALTQLVSVFGQVDSAMADRAIDKAIAASRNHLSVLLGESRLPMADVAMISGVVELSMNKARIQLADAAGRQ